MGAFLHRINPGQKGHQTEICHDDSVLITGWTELPDVRELATQEAIRNTIMERRGDSFDQAKNRAGYLRLFVFDMHPGDLIVAPVPEGWHIARIDGDAYYDPSDIALTTRTAWRRRVTWYTTENTPVDPAMASPALAHAVKHLRGTTRQIHDLETDVADLIAVTGIGAEDTELGELVDYLWPEAEGDETPAPTLRYLAKRRATALLESASPDDTFAEGAVSYALHRVRERDHRAVALKKAAVLSEHGCLRCEVCGFDFQEAWPTLGEGFIECHHIEHLSEGERDTCTGDLALVCSNCHRMFHRVQTGTSVEALKTLLALPS